MPIGRCKICSPVTPPVTSPVSPVTYPVMVSSDDDMADASDNQNQRASAKPANERQTAVAAGNVVKRNKVPGVSAKQKANERQTAVAAVNPTYNPFEDTLGAAPFDYTYSERMANLKRMQKKRYLVELALKTPKTLTESIKDARKQIRWMNRNIGKSCKIPGLEDITRQSKGWTKQWFNSKQWRAQSRDQTRASKRQSATTVAASAAANEQSRSSRIRTPQKIVDALAFEHGLIRGLLNRANAADAAKRCTAPGESTIDFTAAMMTAELKACIDKQVADASAAMIQ